MGTFSNARIAARLATLLLTALLLASSLVVSLPDLAYSQSCSKLDSVKVASGSKFICKKVAGKLVWVKQAAKIVAQPSVTKAPASKPTPKPKPVLPKEYSACTKPGQDKGAGAEQIVCVEYQGELVWIRLSALRNPDPGKACERVDMRGRRAGVEMICVRTAEGKVWEYVDQEMATLKRFKLSLGGCHATGVGAVQKLVENKWIWAENLRATRSSECPESHPFKVSSELSLPTMSLARFFIMGGSWSLYSEPLTLINNTVTYTAMNSVIEYRVKASKVNYFPGIYRGLDLVQVTQDTGLNRIKLTYRFLPNGSVTTVPVVEVDGVSEVLIDSKSYTVRSFKQVDAVSFEFEIDTPSNVTAVQTIQFNLKTNQSPFNRNVQISHSFAW